MKIKDLNLVYIKYINLQGNMTEFESILSGLESEVLPDYTTCSYAKGRI